MLQPQLAHPPSRPSNQGLRALLQGTRQVTVFNMSDRSVADGPDLPLRSNHGMAAMSAEGRLHALVAGTYLLASDDPAQNGWLHHLVWDFAGGARCNTDTHAICVACEQRHGRPMPSSPPE